jgi:hypothetical protein
MILREFYAIGVLIFLKDFSFRKLSCLEPLLVSHKILFRRRNTFHLLELDFYRIHSNKSRSCLREVYEIVLCWLVLATQYLQS